MPGRAAPQSSMHSVSHSVTRRGGLAATHELHSDGWGRGAIRTAVRAGDVIPVRQGWYAGRGIPPLVLGAVRVGGRLTCATALVMHGCWDLGDPRLHVIVDPTASRLRLPHDKRTRLADQPAGVRVHWRASAAEGRLVMPPLECFVDAIGCLRDDLVLVLADSYLRAHPASRSTWPRSIREMGTRAHFLLEADGICESGTETLFYTRFRELAPRRQVVIPGIGRVDFLIGDRLVIEIDGAEFHSSGDRFEADRRRDALLSQRGYRVLRFTYRQVMFRWPEVEAAVWAAVARGDRY